MPYLGKGSVKLRKIVAVTSLIGMRFSMRIRSGRMSWLYARAAFMTKMFSPSRMLAAGRLLGILIGILYVLPFHSKLIGSDIA